MPAKTDITEILQRFDDLPNDAVVPTRVVALLHAVSDRTVRREYPVVRLTPNRTGVRVGDLRAMSRNEKA
jgi:hypothetical protein